MKKLKKFQTFDHVSFFKDKTLVYLDGKKDDDCLKVTLMIADDNTDYGDGYESLNAFEKFTVKVFDEDESYLNNFKRMTQVHLEVSKALVWGDYSQNLSITGKIYEQD